MKRFATILVLLALACFIFGCTSSKPATPAAPLPESAAPSETPAPKEEAAPVKNVNPNPIPKEDRPRDPRNPKTALALAPMSEPAAAPAVAPASTATTPAATPLAPVEFLGNEWFRFTNEGGKRYIHCNPAQVPGDRSKPFFWSSKGGWKVQPFRNQDDRGWWVRDLPPWNYKLRCTYGGASYPGKHKEEYSWADINDAGCVTHRPDIAAEFEFNGVKVFLVPCRTDCEECGSG